MLFAALFLCATNTGYSKNPQHEGTIQEQHRCFYPQSGYVAEICFSYSISWKMWILMGEPVEDYHLTWELKSYSLIKPSEHSDLSQTNVYSTLPAYTLGTHRAEFDKAFNKSRLYIEAESEVRDGMQEVQAYRRFNTGNAVEQRKSSLNVPGSPSWTKFFRKNRGCEKEADHFDEKQAKNIFSKKLSLVSIEFCNEATFFSLDAVERLADKICSDGNVKRKPEFCDIKIVKKEEKKPVEKKSTVDVMEDMFASLDSQKKPDKFDQAKDINSKFDVLESKLKAEGILAKRMRLLQEQNYDRAVEACNKFFEKIDTCLVEQRCPRPQLPVGLTEKECMEATVCPAVTKLPHLTSRNLNERCDRECRRERRREEREQEQRDQEKKEKWAKECDERYSKVQLCEPFKLSKKKFDNCSKNIQSVCNPQGLQTKEECLNNEVNLKQPNELELKKQLQIEHPELDFLAGE